LTLIEGLKTPPVDPIAEKAFVFGGKAVATPEPAAVPPPTPQFAAAPSRVPISTRMRGDYATALKRASLERQLSGVEPNSLQDILEQAVEPWLRANGYLT
jgi:hypothetical protein